MKSTGVVRRIDDLGRVVIPKEIRRTLRINEGDPMEIFTSENNIVLKKYSVLGTLNDIANKFCGILKLEFSDDIIFCITDTDSVLGVSNRNDKKNLLSHSLDFDFIQKIRQREIFSDSIKITDDSELKCNMTYPITVAGEICGSLIVYSKTELDLTKIDVACGVIIRLIKMELGESISQ